MGLILAVIAALIALAVFYAARSQITMRNALPPSSTIAPHEIDGMLREGYPLIAVLGTGSMQPYIPAGTGRVAWCMVERCDFRVLGKGDLVVFSTKGGNIVHQLAQLTGAGWITSGLHNSSYDSTRVYPENFIGRVVKTYILKP